MPLTTLMSKCICFKKTVQIINVLDLDTIIIKCVSFCSQNMHVQFQRLIRSWAKPYFWNKLCLRIHTICLYKMQHVLRTLKIRLLKSFCWVGMTAANLEKVRGGEMDGFRCVAKLCVGRDLTATDWEQKRFSHNCFSFFQLVNPPPLLILIFHLRTRFSSVKSVIARFYQYFFVSNIDLGSLHANPKLLTLGILIYFPVHAAGIEPLFQNSHVQKLKNPYKKIPPFKARPIYTSIIFLIQKLITNFKFNRALKFSWKGAKILHNRSRPLNSTVKVEPKSRMNKRKLKKKTLCCP